MSYLHARIHNSPSGLIGILSQDHWNVIEAIVESLDIPPDRLRVYVKRGIDWHSSPKLVSQGAEVGI